MTMVTSFIKRKQNYGSIKRKQNCHNLIVNIPVSHSLTDVMRMITIFKLILVAYCQQHQYVRLAIYTDLFTVLNVILNVTKIFQNLSKIFALELYFLYLCYLLPKKEKLPADHFTNSKELKKIQM